MGRFQFVNGQSQLLFRVGGFRRDRPSIVKYGQTWSIGDSVELAACWRQHLFQSSLRQSDIKKERGIRIVHSDL